MSKPTAITPSSNTTIQGKLDFKGMRFPIHIILMALDLYFLNESSTSRISPYLFRTFNIKVSHVTIASWTKKFAAYFKLKSDNLLKNIDLSDSDEWHADETVVFIFHYNFIRNHSSLRGLTPAEVSGINYSAKAKNNWLLAA